MLILLITPCDNHIGKTNDAWGSLNGFSERRRRFAPVLAKNEGTDYQCDAQRGTPREESHFIRRGCWGCRLTGVVGGAQPCPVVYMHVGLSRLLMMHGEPY